MCPFVYIYKQSCVNLCVGGGFCLRTVSLVLSLQGLLESFVTEQRLAVRMLPISHMDTCGSQHLGCSVVVFLIV